MIDIIKFLAWLGKILPITEVLALVKAGTPLPADWKDAEKVGEWLTRVGVTGPLAAVVLAVLRQLQPVYSIEDSVDVDAVVRECCPDEEECVVCDLCKFVHAALAWLRGS